jgi:hypothetical protein
LSNLRIVKPAVERRRQIDPRLHDCRLQF